MAAKKQYQDEEWLYDRYWGDEMTMGEMGDIVDVHMRTIHKWMKEYQIPRRNTSEWASAEDPRLDDPEWLADQYWGEGKTAMEVAEKCGVTFPTVLRYMDRHEIGRRELGRNTSGDLHKLKSSDWLREKYIDEEKSIREIATVLNLSPTPVKNWLEKHNIDTRPSSRHVSGEDHPLWKGGHEKYYGPNWEEQREKALERDRGRCQSCGMHREDHWRDLPVHHIRPIRTFRNGDAVDYAAANKVGNLVTLCDSCHPDWEGIPLRPQYAD